MGDGGEWHTIRPGERVGGGVGGGGGGVGRGRVDERSSSAMEPELRSFSRRSARSPENPPPPAGPPDRVATRPTDK